MLILLRGAYTCYFLHHCHHFCCTLICMYKKSNAPIALCHYNTMVWLPNVKCGRLQWSRTLRVWIVGILLLQHFLLVRDSCLSLCWWACPGLMMSDQPRTYTCIYREMQVGVWADLIWTRKRRFPVKCLRVLNLKLSPLRGEKSGCGFRLGPNSDGWVTPPFVVHDVKDILT